MLSSTAKIPGIENGGHHIVSTTIHFNSIFNNVYSLTPFFMVSALIFYSLSIVIDASYPFISKHNYVYLVISINTISMLMFIVSLILGLVGTPNY
ncbi:MAG: hypothetical protein WCR67_07330, partial [Bacilli bacterium]